jgi:taspase (threonine aspartase 1)
MISPVAKSEWRKWKERLETSEAEEGSPMQKSIHDVQDTVGAVAWTDDGGMAAGVSR